MKQELTMACGTAKELELDWMGVYVNDRGIRKESTSFFELLFQHGIVVWNCIVVGHHASILVQVWIVVRQLNQEGRITSNGCQIQHHKHTPTFSIQCLPCNSFQLDPHIILGTRLIDKWDHAFHDKINIESDRWLMTMLAQS